MIKATVDLQSIPRVLRDLPQWVLWKVVERDGEPTKVPFCVDGQPAKANDATTWTTFDTVVERFHRGGYTGIGFEFSADDEFTGVDLDSCIDRSGNIANWAQRILDRFRGRAYAEISPSGTGIKLVVKARPRASFNVKVNPISGNKLTKSDEKPAGKVPGIECYGVGRYFAITGQTFEGFTEPGDAQEVVDELVDKFKPEPPPRAAAGKPAERTGGTSVIDRARKYLAKGDQAVSGNNGSGTTFRLACALVLGFGLKPDEAYPLMAEWSETCEPPWSEDELRHKLDDADKQPGERGYLLNAERNGHAAVTPIGSESCPTSEVPGVDRPEGQTEAALSNRLISARGDRIIFVEQQNRFHVFDGRRWADDPGAVRQFAKEQAAALWDEFSTVAPNLEGQQLAKALSFVKSANNGPTIQHVESLVRCDGRVRVISPDVFDQHPHLFNVENGTLDLTTGELRPHDRRDRLTRLAPVVFDPMADWRFFQKWFPAALAIVAAIASLLGVLAVLLI